MAPTWANTLNSQHHYHSHIDKFWQLVKSTGYPYYEWNGLVFKSEDAPLKSHVCTEEDLNAPAKPTEREVLETLAKTGGWVTEWIDTEGGQRLAIVNKAQDIAKRALG